MRREQAFTMIELLIALGVCAIGICSIMVLIPVGANATRDAALETYAAQAAEQLLHYLEYQMSTVWEQDLPNAKPSLQGENEQITWSGIPDFDNILRSNQPGVFMIQSVRGGEDEEDAEEDAEGGEEEEIIVDFRAIMLVWKSDISILGKDKQNFGVCLNVEVSWPAEIPYAARQKALYCLEVFNPNAQNEEP